MASLDLYICVNGMDNVYGTEVNSVGTVNASLTTHLAVEAFKPDFVISVGTCGGFRSQGCDIGTVVLGTQVVNHDRRFPLPVCTGRLTPLSSSNEKAFFFP